MNVAEVLEKCIKYHQPRAEEEINRINRRPPSEVMVYAETKGIRQILDNLVDNAIKYTPKVVKLV